MPMTQNEIKEWKKCSTCKKTISFRQKYYVCSVSTCNGQRTGYTFCSIPCFEAHLPGAKHRDAGAIEKTAPSIIISQNPTPSQNTTAGTTSSTAAPSNSSIPHDILIVASKLKDYIRAKSDMNTSASIMDILSDIVRKECDKAIQSARNEGRKTVLDRDFK